jgi:tetratricopeptide (TPR) repeat protein
MAALEKEFPNAWPVLAQIGTLKAMQNDLPGARRVWERAASIEPSAFEAQRGLARIDLAAGKPDAALARLRGLAQTFPADARYQVELARIHASQRQLGEAEQALRAAIEVDPAAMDAYGLLGQIYLSQNRTDEALREFEIIAEKQPKSIGAHTLIGMILQTKGRTDEAVSRYEQTVQIDRRAAVAANNLAWLYAAEGKGNLDQALDLAQAAREVLPDQPEVNDTLGYIYLKKQIPTLAVPPMLRAVDKDPKNPTYHYRLGQAYLESGSREKAKASLEAALQLQADFPEAADARQLLAQMNQS